MNENATTIAEGMELVSQHVEPETRELERESVPNPLGDDATPDQNPVPYAVVDNQSGHQWQLYDDNQEASECAAGWIERIGDQTFRVERVDLTARGSTDA